MPGNGDKLTMLGNGEWDLYYFGNLAMLGNGDKLTMLGNGEWDFVLFFKSSHAGQRRLGLVHFFHFLFANRA
jgi:hypothetical protein